jgi:hypothetical protein
MLPWLQGRRQNNNDSGGYSSSVPTATIRNTPPTVKTTQTKGETKGKKNGK